MELKPPDALLSMQVTTTEEKEMLLDTLNTF